MTVDTLSSVHDSSHLGETKFSEWASCTNQIPLMWMQSTKNVHRCDYENARKPTAEQRLHSFGVVAKFAISLRCAHKLQLRTTKCESYAKINPELTQQNMTMALFQWPRCPVSGLQVLLRVCLLPVAVAFHSVGAASAAAGTALQNCVECHDDPNRLPGPLLIPPTHRCTVCEGHLHAWCGEGEDSSGSSKTCRHCRSSSTAATNTTTPTHPTTANTTNPTRPTTGKRWLPCLSSQGLFYQRHYYSVQASSHNQGHSTIFSKQGRRRCC